MPQQLVVNTDCDFSQIAAELAKIENYINANVGPAQAPVLVTANGAIPDSATATYYITKGSAAVLTLAAPVVGTDDGKTITLRSTTAFAHTLTATGLLETGSAAVNVATFAAFAGAGLVLKAYQGKWLVDSQVGITFS